MDFDLSYFLSLDPNMVPTNGMVHLSDLSAYVKSMIMWNLFHDFNKARYYLGAEYHV